MIEEQEDQFHILIKSWYKWDLSAVLFSVTLGEQKTGKILSKTI